MRTRAAIWFLPLAALVLGAVLPGCGGQSATRLQRATSDLVPLEQRIDAVLGHTLIIPIEVPAAPSAPEAAVRLEDGRSVTGRFYRISAAAVEDEPAHPWLAAAARWTAAAPGASGQNRDRGGWVFSVDLPPDAFGQSIIVGGKRLALNWYPDPAQMDVDPAVWRPPPWASSATLLDLASPEMRSPLRRWRYRLLIDGLSPHAPDPSNVPFDDPVIEALARQMELRWSLAMGVLWGADPQLAERLRRRLVLGLEFQEGVVAPAWPSDDAAMAALLQDLLNPALSASERSARAAAWLEALPAASVWIVDDAGAEDATTGDSVVTAGVANLLERDMVASARFEGGISSPELRELPPRSVRNVMLTSPPDAGGEIVPRPIGFAIGRWTGVRTVVSDPIPVIPPGLRIEALAADWTMTAWMNGAPDSSMRIAPSESTSILLHLRAPEFQVASADGSALSAARAEWWLHIECRGEGGDTDEVAVWLGAFGAPGAVLRVRPGGVLVEGVRGDREPVSGAIVWRGEGRWVAQVPLPARVIEASGELRLGITRVDGRGRRSAWPRPMLPWQTEPGRLVVNTTMWGSVGEDQPGVR